MKSFFHLFFFLLLSGCSNNTSDSQLGRRTIPNTFNVNNSCLHSLQVKVVEMKFKDWLFDTLRVFSDDKINNNKEDCIIKRQFIFNSDSTYFETDDFLYLYVNSQTTFNSNDLVGGALYLLKLEGVKLPTSDFYFEAKYVTEYTPSYAIFYLPREINAFYDNIKITPISSRTTYLYRLMKGNLIKTDTTLSTSLVQQP